VRSGLPESASATDLFYQANDLLGAQDYDGAAVGFAAAYERLDGPAQRLSSFMWGYSLYMSGREIAMANSDGGAGPAREALQKLRAALALMDPEDHERAEAVINATHQFIENQEAVLRAAQRP
jgi:hypothetical protein